MIRLICLLTNFSQICFYRYTLNFRIFLYEHNGNNFSQWGISSQVEIRAGKTKREDTPWWKKTQAPFATPYTGHISILYCEAVMSLCKKDIS